MKPIEVKSLTTNLQDEITQRLLNSVLAGNIDVLNREMQIIGLKEEKEIASLVDDQSYNQNALFSSCQVKNDQKAMEMTMYLINSCGCDPAMLDTLNQTCLFYVARDGREELARLFIQKGCKANQIDSYGQTPIFYAAREGNLNVMKVLIEAGANGDHVDEEGQTPIFYAVRSEKLACVEYLVENCTLNLNRNDSKGQNLI